MNVIMSAAECVPFVKVGGLADVVHALAEALDRLGARVKVVLPLYRQIRDANVPLEEAAELSPVELLGAFGGSYRVYRTALPKSRVDYLFIEHPEYFDKKGFYDDPETGKGYPDQGERFLFFSKAVSELIIASREPYDVVHLHDHHVAPVSGYLKFHEYPIRLIFHIHNLGYQGNFPPELYRLSDFPPEWFWAGREAEFFGKFSFMKTGIILSDEVVAVSPQYAKEIITIPEFGMGMEGILAAKGEHFRGILNGIDIEEWNPETDSLTPYHYGKEFMDGKLENRKVLREKFGLSAPMKDTPVIGMITRLAEQKGIDLVIDAMHELMELPLQMVILGTGQLSYQEALLELSRAYPKKLGVRLKFDNALAHLIEAGSNMFLMPSRYEPCGLNQLYSMRYGTIPIVRSVGGLKDTVKPVSQNGSLGWGFTFDEMKLEAMLKAVSDAVMSYGKKELWSEIVGRAMSLDFSWEQSARKFLELYKKS